MPRSSADERMVIGTDAAEDEGAEGNGSPLLDAASPNPRSRCISASLLSATVFLAAALLVVAGVKGLLPARLRDDARTVSAAARQLARGHSRGRGSIEADVAPGGDPCEFLTAGDGKVALVNDGPCIINLENKAGVWHEYRLSRTTANEVTDPDKQTGGFVGGKKSSKDATIVVAEDDDSHGSDDKEQHHSNGQSRRRRRSEKHGGKAAEEPSHSRKATQSDSKKHGGKAHDNSSTDASPEKKGDVSANSTQKDAVADNSSISNNTVALSAGACESSGHNEKHQCCSQSGCGPYDPARSCQCNSECESHSNCCPDFEEVCLPPPAKDAVAGTKTSKVDASAHAHTPAPPTPAPTAATPAPTPPPPKPKGFPSLLCFSVIRSEGGEIGLVGAQLDRHASIFACDDTLIFSNGPSITVGTLSTISIPTEMIGMGNLALEGETTNSWLNTAIFMEVWKWIVSDSRFQKYDWTVKVDPDAVFFPERLRDHVKAYTPPGGANYYMTNCNKIFASNPADEVFKEKLFGSLEVFSRQAVQAYQAGHDRCNDELKWHGWGEDYFMQSCLNLLGVLPVGDFGMVADKRCFEAPCTDTGKVAFHDFKDISAYFNCWEQSLGPDGVKRYGEPGK